MDDRQPGMYYVPYEGMRYWDGEKWTDQDPSADSPTLPPTEGSQVGTQSATEAARIRTGRSGRVVMLCIAMLAAGAAAVALASGSVSTSGLASALGFPGEAEAAAAPAVAAQAKVATPTPAKGRASVKSSPPPAKAGKAPAAPRTDSKSSPSQPTTSQPTTESSAPRPAKPAPPRAPAPTPSTHQRTAADCLGYLVAESQVIASRITATLKGTITNESGLDVKVIAQAPVVEAWDTNGQHVRLFGSFASPPKDGPGESSNVTLHPGDSISYRSVALPMQTPDRNWESLRWAPLTYLSMEDSNFCQQGDVPGVHILR